MRRLLLLLPLPLGDQPERRNGLCLAKDDLPRAFPTDTRFLCAGKLQAALPFPSEVVGWKSPKSRGWEWQGSAAGASRATQLWTGELSLKRTDRHQEVPETSLSHWASSLDWGFTAAARAGLISGASWELQCCVGCSQLSQGLSLVPEFVDRSGKA